jgi:hypothetical protein
MEDFFNAIRSFYPNVPAKITSENVNTTFDNINILDYAINKNLQHIVLELLKFNPRIGYYNLTACRRVEMLKILLEYDPDASNCIDPRTTDHILDSYFAADPVISEMLLDYGSNYYWIRNGTLYRNNDYILLVKHRISSCRQALLALIRVCRRSKLRPLRGVILEIATQAWAMRGGEGCGARAHKWIK